MPFLIWLSTLHSPWDLYFGICFDITRSTFGFFKLHSSRYSIKCLITRRNQNKWRRWTNMKFAFALSEMMIIITVLCILVSCVYLLPIHNNWRYGIGTDRSQKQINENFMNTHPKQLHWWDTSCLNKIHWNSFGYLYEVQIVENSNINTVQCLPICHICISHANLLWL